MAIHCRSGARVNKCKTHHFCRLNGLRLFHSQKQVLHFCIAAIHLELPGDLTVVSTIRIIDSFCGNMIDMFIVNKCEQMHFVVLAGAIAFEMSSTGLVMAATTICIYSPSFELRLLSVSVLYVTWTITIGVQPTCSNMAGQARCVAVATSVVVMNWYYTWYGRLVCLVSNEWKMILWSSQVEVILVGFC